MTKKAYLAGGCFWGLEELFRTQPGIIEITAGYTGGQNTNPTYDNHPGHAEALEIVYDDAQTSFWQLLDFFFQIHNPTTLNRQGNDVGTEYRSIAFYRNEKEKQVILAEIARLTAAKKYDDKIVTEVVPFKAFYPAEDYHQEYISNNPDNPYVQHVSIPEFLRFKKAFKGNFKQ